MRTVSYCVAVIGAAIATSSCVTQQAASPPPTQQYTKLDGFVPVKTTPDFMKKFQSLIQHRLKDPDSARYRGVVASVNKQNDFHALCGYINAKNSYGGYGGEKLFTAGFDKTGADIVISDGTAFVDRGLLRWCYRYGVTPN